MLRTGTLPLQPAELECVLNRTIMHLTPNDLWRSTGGLWKTPASPREMECAAEFGVAAFHKGRVSAWQLLLVSCADHPCVLMEKKKSVYRRDYSLYTGTHYTFLDLCFVWCCPNPQLSGLGFLFHTSIVIWNFTICMGPWRSQPSKELVFAYNIQFSSPKKIKKGNLQFRHDLDWILSNVRQVVTLYEKLQCCALTSSSQPLILSGTSWNWYKEGRWGIGQKKTSALPWFLQRQQTQLVNTVQLIFPKLFLSNRLDSKEGLFG